MMHDAARRHYRLRALSVLAAIGWLLAPWSGAAPGAGNPLGGGRSPVVWAAPVTQPVEQAKPPLFEDSFADNHAGWLEDDAHYFDQDGYHLSFLKSDQSLLYHANPKNPQRFADVSVEAQFTFIEGNDSDGFGVSLRSTVVPRRHYWLLIDALGSYALGRTTEAGVVTLVSWRRSPALNQGNATNTIRLVARGKRVSAFLNGQQVASIQDEAIPESGAFELLASSGQHVLVQHVVVTESTDKDVSPLPAGPGVLFQDNFFDNREQWPVGDTAYMDADGYHIAIPDQDEPASYVLVPRTAPYAKDVVAEVSLRKIDGPDDAAYGLVVRYGGQPRHAYYLSLTGEGSYALDSRSSSGTVKSVIPWRRSPALRTGSAPNTIRLAINGNTLFVTFNGVPVARVRDDAVGDPGWVGLDVETGLHVVVRSMTVTESTEQDVALPATPTAVPAPASPTISPPATPPAASPTTTPNATPAVVTPTPGATATK